MERILRYSMVLAVAAFFAVMWGLLLRSHLPVEAPQRLRPDYDALLPPDQQERSASWEVFFAGERIGGSETKVFRQDDGMIAVQTRTRIHIKPAARLVLGIAGTLDLQFEATISPLRGLQAFEVSSDLLDANVLGTVGRGRMLLAGHVGHKRLTGSIPYDADRLVSEVFSPLAGLPRLSDGALGREWTVDMFNPLTGRMENVRVSVIGSTDLVLADGRATAFRLLFASGSDQWVCWVAKDGRLLVQGTPFGLSLWREGIPPDAAAELRKGMAHVRAGEP